MSVERDKDTQALIEAALAYVYEREGVMNTTEGKWLVEALKLFRQKKARIGTLTDSNGILCSGTKAIELTPAIQSLVDTGCVLTEDEIHEAYKHQLGAHISSSILEACKAKVKELT